MKLKKALQRSLYFEGATLAFCRSVREVKGDARTGLSGLEREFLGLLRDTLSATNDVVAAAARFPREEREAEERIEQIKTMIADVEAGKVRLERKHDA